VKMVETKGDSIPLKYSYTTDHCLSLVQTYKL
jgi:hypothetical protein